MKHDGVAGDDFLLEFDVVDFAYVEIVIPETRLFAATQPPVTASILIKRRNGAIVNDETIYAIMQMVSNSVENLTPENISVVDTEGRLLSAGILERVQNKIKEIQETQLTETVGQGKVIIPKIDEVADWFQIKFDYETLLEKKIINQLNGVLPIGSYKAAVTIDMNTTSKTGVPDIKRIVTSIVIDEQFTEINLTPATTDQIRSATAGAIGFVKDRDIIHISRASFLPKRTRPSTDTLLPKSINLDAKTSIIFQLKRLSRLWPIAAIGTLITSTFVILIIGIRKVMKKVIQKQSQSKDVSIEDTNNPIDNATESSEKIDLATITSKANVSDVIKLKASSIEDTDLMIDEIKQLINT